MDCSVLSEQAAPSTVIKHLGSFLDYSYQWMKRNVSITKTSETVIPPQDASYSPSGKKKIIVKLGSPIKRLR